MDKTKINKKNYVIEVEKAQTWLSYIYIPSFFGQNMRFLFLLLYHSVVSPYTVSYQNLCWVELLVFCYALSIL